MTALDLDRLEALADATNRDLPWWGPNTLMNGRPRLTEADAVFIAETGPDVVKELIRQLREAREERDKAARAVQTYSHVIEQQCTDVLNATGAHHLIQEDGDGDWMGVWEIMHELCQKGKAANG
ncbi:hypothetical protein [Arthrobacter woluwensis]|uniref:hypothetical protein n=1 Tax=Arthrobacter woluwensis TaxID=156980 RepID=UPI0011A86A3A|nr:hypothetical protein [Arthrobacter woluwensis]